jgi:hypothetical protein
VRQKRDSKRTRRPSEPGSQRSPHGAPAREIRHSGAPKEALAGAGQPHRGSGHAEPVIEIKPASRMRTINRWLLVIVPLFVLATVAWRYREHRKLEYPAIVERGLKEGISALDSAAFDKAYQLLSAAKSAVDGLGGDVDGAEEIRRAADEAGIFVKLITQDLGELLAEAGQTDPDTWASRFDSVYKGRSIFVDSIITAVPDGTASSRYELLLRIVPPGEATRRDGQPDLVAEIDLTGFKLFELVGPERGSRVPFGARLASFKYDATGTGASRGWVIRLEPDSGVIITHTKALDSLGWRQESVLPPEGRELAP